VPPTDVCPQGTRHGSRRSMQSSSRSGGGRRGYRSPRRSGGSRADRTLGERQIVPAASGLMHALGSGALPAAIVGLLRDPTSNRPLDALVMR
jgi:hypothetical protein